MAEKDEKRDILTDIDENTINSASEVKKESAPVLQPAEPTHAEAEEDLLLDSDYSEKKRFRLPKPDIKRFEIKKHIQCFAKRLTALIRRLTALIKRCAEMIGEVEVSFALRVWTICAAVLILVFAAAFAHKPEGGEISEAFVKRASVSNEYNRIYDENEKLAGEAARLKEKLAQKEEDLKNLQEFLEGNSSLEKKASDTNDRLYDINSEVKALEEEQQEKNRRLNTSKSGVVVMSPGIYTVGKHLYKGSYSVIGSGALNIADEQNKSKVNTALSDTAQTVVLEDGDTVKLEGSVSLTRIGG